VEWVPIKSPGDFITGIGELCSPMVPIKSPGDFITGVGEHSSPMVPIKSPGDFITGVGEHSSPMVLESPCFIQRQRICSAPERWNVNVSIVSIFKKELEFSSSFIKII
jgi:hypothetical protein